MEIRKIINITIAILMLLYVVYCWVNQGSHARGKGWRTRWEAPKTFWFNIIFFTVVSIFMIVTALVELR